MNRRSDSLVKSIELYADDIFLLGNIAVEALRSGVSQGCQEIADLISTERPQNAAGPMIKALYCLKNDDLQQAIAILETKSVFNAQENRENALLLYLSTLREDGQVTRMKDLASSILEDDISLSPETQHALIFFAES